MAAERLGLGTQVRQLKIGKSFTNSASVGRGGRAAHQPPLSKGASFHTIRYDFKPASVDPEKRGSLVVAEDGRSVNVNVPNLDPGREQTNYRLKHKKDIFRYRVIERKWDAEVDLFVVSVVWTVSNFHQYSYNGSRMMRLV